MHYTHLQDSKIIHELYRSLLQSAFREFVLCAHDSKIVWCTCKQNCANLESCATSHYIVVTSVNQIKDWIYIGPTGFWSDLILCCISKSREAILKMPAEVRICIQCRRLKNRANVYDFQNKIIHYTSFFNCIYFSWFRVCWLKYFIRKLNNWLSCYPLYFPISMSLSVALDSTFLYVLIENTCSVFIPSYCNWNWSLFLFGFSHWNLLFFMPEANWASITSEKIQDSH